MAPDETNETNEVNETAAMQSRIPSSNSSAINVTGRLPQRRHTVHYASSPSISSISTISYHSSDDDDDEVTREKEALTCKQRQRQASGSFSDAFGPGGQGSASPVPKNEKNEMNGKNVKNEKQPGRGRSQSESLGRRASRRVGGAIAHTIQAIDPLQPRENGNPLDLQVNEVRRLRSTGYANWSAFNARRHVEAGPPPTASSALDKYCQEQGPVYVRPGMSDSEDDYTITRLAKYDDIEQMSKFRRWAYKLSGVGVVLSVGAYFLYFVLRVLYTRAAQRSAHTTFYMAWVLIGVEMCVLIPNLLHRVWGLHAIGKRTRPKLRIVGENVPSVDVIITCCGEDDDLVLDTAKAACNIDYPASRFRVIICDDGRSARLQAMAERTAAELFDNLYYRSRPKYPGVPHHFKAGNLNYALGETKKLPGGAASFFAALDADMIPERDWMRAMIPHMLQDPKCSMACPPQLFYNVPKDDPLCQSLDLFVHVSEPLKDSLGVAWCTGSGYVMRRSALDSIGGFPVGSLAEDVYTSTMFLGMGWTTAFVHEPLQFGTVPDSLAGHLKQRTRWTIGTIQTSIKLRFCVYGEYVRRMTFYQRLCGFIYTLSSFFTFALVLAMVAAPVVLVSGGNLVPYNDIRQLQMLIRVWFASHIINRLNECINYLPSSYLTGQREARSMLWMAVFQSLCIVRTFFLPTWLGGKVAVFTSSGSQKTEIHERDRKLRAPLWRRLKFAIWDCQCFIHLSFICFTLAAVGLATYWNVKDSHTTKERFTAILTHAAWPPVIWLSSLMSCWIPIGYAISPPDCPPREDLLERDPVTGVAYPKAASKKTVNGWGTYAAEVQNSLLSLYTCGVFVYSFWLS